MDKSFDLIVIGAGPGGYVAAIRAAQLGLKVAVIEREHMGGVCLNWGCIPTKAMLHSVELLRMMRRATAFGLELPGAPTFRLEAIVERSRKISRQLSSGISYLMKKNKIETLSGTARLVGPGRIAVEAGTEAFEVSGNAIIIATGARARDLPGLEADGDRVWSYRHALRPRRTPGSLLVVGSGAIGVEFASFYAGLGARVTLVEARERILPNEDAEISICAKKEFQKQGIEIIEAAGVVSLERPADGPVKAHLKLSGGVEVREFDIVISAVGITGNVEDLGLESLGIEVAGGHIVVDEYCRTAVAGIYAIGDVAGAPWLAHKASHEGVMVAELVAGLSPQPIQAENIPACTFCHPQIASIGLTEEQAAARGRELRIGRFPLSASGKAFAIGETEGFVKTIFDKRTGDLLGAHMIGAEVTEMIQGFAVAKTLGTTEEALIETVYAHPTISEGMQESVLAAWERAIHI